MTQPQAEPVDTLQAHVQPIAPQDLMAEAGRKALLNDLIKMQEYEPGVRLGEDPEAVHDMRVATRRMRSTLRLLAVYYKPKAIDPYLSDLRKLARALGAVRDLDVMVGNFNTYLVMLAPAEREALQPVVSELEAQRADARKTLIRLLDKGSYHRFSVEFGVFLTKSGKGARAVDLEEVRPFQVRHLLPILIYEHLGAVRAYDGVIENADDPTLHALRIEFKRLRYTVSVFAEVLGSTSSEFIDELKKIQDLLGEITDIRAAQERLRDIGSKLEAQSEAAVALQKYIEQLDQNRKTLRESFGAAWVHFNTRTVQRQLASAVASL